MLYSVLEYAKMEYEEYINPPMRLNDFYSDPPCQPAQYSDDFLEKNKNEMIIHQKDLQINYQPFFETKRFFYLFRSHLMRKFFIGQASFSGLGDTVLYSHLPRLIKLRWPDHKVFVYETVYSSVVFPTDLYIWIF